MPGSVKETSADGGGRQQTHRTARWAKAKLILRIVIIVGSGIATIVSLAWIGAPRYDGGWILFTPLYALPYTILSLVWEASELITLRVRARGIHSVAHLVCELILWLGGLPCGIIWIDFTAMYESDAYDQYTYEADTEQLGTSWEAYYEMPAAWDTFKKWADVNYFWGTVVLLTAICQFTIFVLACIEVDREINRKRAALDNNINRIVQMIGSREQKPEDTIASLRQAGPHSTEPTWPVEMLAMNTDPVEMHAEERPLEMFGDLGVREMPARAW
ncbi:hypothetical protein VMCG_05078 [Cytospora schulzeri]|uniref:MARVEL domain-containing protein n=1 Tax=Cytospora schulzeri TaxID=448051 RepID=A0A423WMC7_9PEZI|nr:hypothetical protein VMCG_05078 [Valsa malicola]